MARFALPPGASRATLAVLVVANLLPLAGVAFLGWRVSDVVFVYWAENLVIGVYNVARMVLSQGPLPPEEPEGLGEKVFLSAFFVLHYGGFCFGHGVFLAVLFPPSGPRFARELEDVLPELLSDPLFLVAVGALVASHGFSFLRHYVFGDEMRTASAQVLMGRPYSRILVVHAFILLGGFLAMWMESPLPAMLLFIVLKVALDGWAHLREHRGAVGLERQPHS